MDDSHCLHALGGLDVIEELVEGLVELEEEVEELDDARKLEIFVRELLREVLLHVHELVGLGWLWRDLHLGGLVAPQVLEHLAIVALDVVPRHLVLLGVDVLALPLHVGVVVAVLVLAQNPLGFDVVGALESWCRIEDWGLLDNHCARHVEECLMSVYLSQRG